MRPWPVSTSPSPHRGSPSLSWCCSSFNRPGLTPTHPLPKHLPPARNMLLYWFPCWLLNFHFILGCAWFTMLCESRCIAKWFSYTNTCMYSFSYSFSHRDYYRILSRVPCGFYAVSSLSLSGLVESITQWWWSNSNSIPSWLSFLIASPTKILITPISVPLLHHLPKGLYLLKGQHP